METSIWTMLACLLSQSVSEGCELGWTEFRELCYGVIPFPVPPGAAIVEARSECRKVGADLIAIKTEEHQQLLESLFTDENGTILVKRGVYIAGGDAMVEGFYQWFDGTPVNYSKWRSNKGEPDNRGPDGIPENCIRVKSGYKKSKDALIDSLRGLWLTTPCLLPAVPVDATVCQKPIHLSEGRQRVFVRLKQAYFSSHEIASYSEPASFRCISHCLNDHRCLSVNWNWLHLTDNCVLNNATRWEDNEVLLTNQTDGMDPSQWHYYETVYPAYGI